MEEAQTQPGSQPSQTPAPKAEEERSFKRITVLLLFTLFTLSLAAGIVLVRYGDGAGRLGKAIPLLAKSIRQPAIGWLAIRGPIYDSSDGRPWSVTPLDQWARRLKDYAEDSQVKAIVLEINSPGGSVGAVQEIHRQILEVRRKSKKPVVALMGDVAASGGYYLAAACDRIIAHPGTLTGSIGVIFTVMNFEGLMKKIGVSSQPIKSGKHKDIGSSMRPMTAEERKILQDLIDDAYGQFLEAVSQGRDIPAEKLRPLADGRIFTGAQAKALGLVDEIGTSVEAIEAAKELGKIKGDPKIIRRSEDMFGRLFWMLDSMMVPEETRLRNVLGLYVPGPGLEYRWTGQ